MDFLLAICTRDYLREVKLSALGNRAIQAMLSADFDGLDCNTLLPVRFQRNAWWIAPWDAQAMTIKVNDQPVQEKLLEHGDVIEVAVPAHSLSFSLLAVDLSRHRLNCPVYQLPLGHAIQIGSDAACDICCTATSQILPQHATMQEHDGQVWLQSAESASIYLNGRLTESTPVAPGAQIAMLGLKLIVLGTSIAITGLAVTVRLPEQHTFPLVPVRDADTLPPRFFSRSPRIMKALEAGTQDIDAPPALQPTQPFPVLLSIGPSLTMALAMLASIGVALTHANVEGAVMTSGLFAVSMLISAILWPVLMRQYQRGREREERRLREERYTAYIKDQIKQLHDKQLRNRAILTNIVYPPVSEIVGFLHSPDKERRLWERTVEDADFLDIRLGLGTRDFDVQIHIPKRGFSMHQDALTRKPEQVFEDFRRISDVPITIPLLQWRTVGMIGLRRHIVATAKCTALSLAGLHAYDEVKLVFIYPHSEYQEFGWVKELPHVWSDDRTVRYVASTVDEVHHIFSCISELITERQEKRSQSDSAPLLPHFVFFIMDDRLAEDEPLMRLIADPVNSVACSAFFVYGEISALPKDCRAIVLHEDSMSGIYYKDGYQSRFDSFAADTISPDAFYAFSQRLATKRVKISSRNLSLPERVSFLSMYQVGNVGELHIEERWRNSESHKSLAALIGVKAGGELFALDIHEKYHGCHGLVAGTTGAGKSEFLQAYIISAAINYHPHDLAFVLIDYKGGGMANIFDGMPHIAGKITNLSGSLLNRSLLSIKAELHRRQRLFNEHAINHIDKYQRLYKDHIARVPLPHLVIICDEFAQLKAQQPDFMRELIDVAQIGRSLGIHLILATQKPAGLVDDQIWSNSKFRVCLKVLDRYDSNDMIKRPDAATLKIPGRCYIQVGYDEIFELIQAGYSGVEYQPTAHYIDDEAITVAQIDNTAQPLRSIREEIASERTGMSQLEAVIRNIIEISRQQAIETPMLWLDPLPSLLPLPELPGCTPDVLFTGSEWPDNQVALSVPVGLLDIPAEKQQPVLSVDPMLDGHVLLYGAASTGKTTFLQTLLYGYIMRFSPDRLQYAIFDFGGRNLGYFADAPHCAGVCYADDAEGVEAMLRALLDEVETRKTLFAEKHVTTYESYIGAGGVLPAIVLVIDNYGVFRERYYQLEEHIVRLAANAKTYGIFLIMTANSKNAVYYKITEQIACILTLRLNDSSHSETFLMSPPGWSRKITKVVV